MLLSTCSSSSAAVEVEQHNPLTDYLRRVSGQEKDPDAITVDHCYSKLWSNHPDAHHTKPARLLFLKGFQNNVSSSEISNVPLDVESAEPSSVPPFDNSKNRGLSEECEQFLETSLPNENNEEKEAVNKAGWTASQKNLYKQVMKILQGSRLSRLAYSGSNTGFIKRKVGIDEGARKMRRLFAVNGWDMTLLGWLHRTLLDHLTVPLLTEYFEILKTLKTKVSSLVDKFLSQFGDFHASLFGAASAEAFAQLIRKPCDPVTNAVSQLKPNKLPGNPMIIVVPRSPNQTGANQSQRMKFWINNLSSLGKVVQLPVHVSPNIPVDESLNQIYTVARNKVAELRNHSPKRPTILVGWHVGALIACHVALEEPVTAVICLGFSLKGVNGSRGDLDDPLLDSKVPTLFVIGQNSCTCSMDDIEDFRERMRAETGLVVVGGADDMLRVSSVKKKTEGITQSMVDRCVVDEITDFLNPILNHLHAGSQVVQNLPAKKPVVVQEEQQVVEDGKRPRRRPREYSPEISPVRKKARPVGRPSLQKVLTSSSSSDTSSVGSCANEATAVKRDKRLVVQKPVKPVEKLSRVQMFKNSIIQRHSKAPEAIVRKEKLPDEVKASTKESAPPLPPPSPAHLPSPKPSTSTKVNPATKILAEQQKNGPVDVEKAFGKDSSFLPRPLTPAEFDSSETAINPVQIDKPPDMTNQSAALDSAALLASALDIAPPPPPAPAAASNKPVIGVSLSSILASPEKQKISYLKTSVDSYPLTTFSTRVSSTVAIQKPQVVAKISEPVFDSTKACIMPVQKVQASDAAVTPVTLSAAGSQTKILKNAVTGMNLKGVQGFVSLAGKGILTASSANPLKSQTVFVTSQTGKKPTFFVQSSEAASVPSGTIQFRRMLVQGNSKVPLLLSTDSGKSSSSEQRSCNLSLLSDVAGMKEPIRHMVHDPQNPTSATLVKLTSSSDLTHTSVKRIVETIPSSSISLPRQETAEEQREKQMAIRALNSSLNEESDPGFTYNIQSSKMEANYLPRSSAMMGYSVVMPRPGSSLSTRFPIRRGRGRSLTGYSAPRKPRVQRFYPF